jgi:hypothetical protein
MWEIVSGRTEENTNLGSATIALMRRARIESIVGLLLISAYLIWTFLYWHQRTTRVTDCFVLVGLVGALLQAHASYRMASRNYR